MATVSYFRSNNATGRNHAHADSAEIKHFPADPVFDIEETWCLTVAWNDGAYVREHFTTKSEAISQAKSLGWGE